MAQSLMDIEGIGPVMATRLKALGIRTTAKLLQAGGTPKGRKDLAEKLGIDERTVLRWTTLADRMRIRGVGEPLATLMHLSGVDTVKEFKHRNPDKLADLMKKVNEKKNIVRQPPSRQRLARWQAIARSLPPVIRY